MLMLTLFLVVLVNILLKIGTGSVGMLWRHTLLQAEIVSPTSYSIWLPWCEPTRVINGSLQQLGWLLIYKIVYYFSILLFSVYSIYFGTPGWDSSNSHHNLLSNILAKVQIIIIIIQFIFTEFSRCHWWV